MSEDRTQWYEVWTQDANLRERRVARRRLKQAALRIARKLKERIEAREPFRGFPCRIYWVERFGSQGR